MASVRARGRAPRCARKAVRADPRRLSRRDHDDDPGAERRGRRARRRGRDAVRRPGRRRSGSTRRGTRPRPICRYGSVPVAGSAACCATAGTRSSSRTSAAVWARRPGRPQADPRLHATPAAFTETEAAGFLADLWELLDVPFVAGHSGRVGAGRVQDAPAAPGGWARLRDPEHAGDQRPGRVPRPLHQELRADDHEAGGTEPAAGDRRGREAARRTIAVRPRELVDLDSVRFAPIMAQPTVDKQVELRVTVVGGEVFSAAIDSQETHHTRIDFRRYDEAHTRITPYALPPAERDLCVALTHALGLRYSTIDLILTPEGRTVFLEINPNGQYLWIEHAAGLPISRAIATLLAEASLS